MIVLVTMDELDEKTGCKTGRQVISHGVHEETFKPVVLPAMTPQEAGAKYDAARGEWVLLD